MRRFAYVFCFLTGCALSPERTIVADDLPADVTHVGWLFADRMGQLVSSTGLLRRDADAIPFPDDDPRDAYLVRMVGYTDAQLAAMNAPAAAVLASSGLAFASPTDPQLVQPTSNLAGFGGSVTRLQPEPSPLALTADWLAPCVSPIPTAVTVGASCATAACLPVVSSNGCGVTIGLAPCGLDDLNVSRTDAGGVVVDHDCAAIADSVTALSIECPGTPKCRIDLWEDPNPLPATVQKLIDVAPRLDASIPDTPYGYLAGLARLDRSVVIATHAGRFVDGDCTAPEEDRFVFVDDSDSSVRTATAPPCLGYVERDPTRDGFFATFGEDHSRLGRFDATGRMIQEAVAIRKTGDSEFRWRAFLAHERSSTMSGLVLDRSKPEADAILLVIDPTDLTLLHSIPDVPRTSRALVEATDRRIAALDFTSGELHVIDLDTESLAETISLETLCGPVGRQIRRIVWDAATLTYVATAGGASPSVFKIADGFGSCERVAYTFDEADVGAVVPFNSQRVLVTSTTQGPAPSVHLSLFEVQTTRLHVGRLDAAPGAVGAITVGPSNAYATLPLTGQLLVIAKGRN